MVTKTEEYRQRVLTLFPQAIAKLYNPLKPKAEVVIWATEADDECLGIGANAYWAWRYASERAPKRKAKEDLIAIAAGLGVEPETLTLWNPVLESRRDAKNWLGPVGLQELPEADIQYIQCIITLVETTVPPGLIDIYDRVGSVSFFDL